MEKQQVVSFKLHPSLLDEIKEIAKNNCTQVSSIIRLALVRFIKSNKEYNGL